jgi:PAS domain S-box-containing protein
MPRPSEQIVQSVLQCPVAMVITNPGLPDNPIEIVNQAFLALTGYQEAEIVGRNCRLLAGERTEPQASAQIGTAIRSGRPVLVDILNYKRDGTPFRNGVMVTPLLGEDGELACFLGSQVELTGDGAAPLTSRSARAAALVGGLPARQREVLQGVAAGLLNKQIAYRLGIAEKTVKMHRALLLERLGVGTTAEAIRIAVEAGL